MTKEKLSDWQWTLVWSSMRYFMGRQTIASATWPADLILNWYYLLSADQKKFLVNELDKYLNEFEQFGNQQIDHPVWIKFKAALDEPKHVTLKLTNGEEVEAFYANGRTYPLIQYLERPSHEVYIPAESIVSLIPLAI